jgi:hypothetical protein
MAFLAQVAKKLPRRSWAAAPDDVRFPPNILRLRTAGRMACSADCGQPSAHEIHCANGADEDCDGDTDCYDEECAGEAACACLPRGAPCTGDADCCSNKCRGNNTCDR